VESLGISHRSGARCSITFEYYYDQADSPSVDEQRPITFPHLRSLDVDIRYPRDAANLLSQINAPAVLDFRIHTTMGVDAVSKYLGYLNACSSFRSLTIHELYMREPLTIAPTALVNTLSMLPSLTHFGLDHVTFDANKLLRELETTHQGLHIVPQLRTIEMTAPGNDVTLKGLLCYVRARCRQSTGPGTMKRIELRSVPPRLAEEYRTSPAVQALQDLGVVVDIYQ
jgi:hypothetical protein